MILYCDSIVNRSFGFNCFDLSAAHFEYLLKVTGKQPASVVRTDGMMCPHLKSEIHVT